MSKLIYPEITSKIRKRSYELYNNLGPLFTEEIYENGLALALNKEGLRVESQKNFLVFYKGIQIGSLFTDLIIEDKIILELKRVTTLQPINQAQIISYLKATKKKLGLLINFGGMKFEIQSFPNYFLKYKNKRFLYKNDNILETEGNLIYSVLSKRILDALYEVYFNLGPGFVHYIYRRAIWHEFYLRDIDFNLEKKIVASYLNQYLGEKDIRLFMIEGKILLAAVAVKKIFESYKEKMKKYLKYFRLKLGLIVNFNSVKLDYCFVIYNK